MKKLFTKFNIVCLSLDIILLLGIVWVWRNTLSLNHPITQSLNNPIVSSLVVDSLSDDNISTLDIVKERDSSSRLSVGTQNDEAVLPKEFLLKVPFTSQAPEKNWDQPWQDACEEASLLMLDAYYKDYGLSPIMARDEILKMVKWEEEKNWPARQASPGEAGGGWGGSIPINNIKIVAEEYFKLNGLKVVENPTIDDIKKSIVKGNPVLVVADGKVLPNPHFRNGGPVYHALIIKGYDEDEFITNDPGTQFGESFKYKYNDLLNAIHDWNGGDVKNGRRAVLIIE